MPNSLESKLPNIGTSIFATMSAMAAEYKAINLSQGFPEFDAALFLRERACKYIMEGYNQYAPMSGVLGLREAIAAKVKACYNRSICPQKNITVTSGATEALFAAIHAVVRPGDEVIILDPAYDSYRPAVLLAGGVCKHLHLSLPDYSIDWQSLKATITSKTRLIIINTPHNPTGAILRTEDMDKLCALLKGTQIYLLADEVYEHIIFDSEQHASVNLYPELWERSFVISSFGKTYHSTGWKVGYAVAPEALSVEFRKVHQFLTFCTSTPMQMAIRDMMESHSNYHLELPAFYEQKRDLFRKTIAKSRFKLLPCSGTYFQLLDYSAISMDDDDVFCEYLTKKIGVAAIPVSAFYFQKPKAQVIRVCFAKNAETLETACTMLAQL